MDLKALSKTISFILRHRPEAFGLVLDGEGWIDCELLLAAIGSRQPAFAQATVFDLERILNTSSKQRFEISEGRIRAYYGHSLAGEIQRLPQEPPAILFHGTSPERAQIIAREGLKPMSRQHVHLSMEMATATIVGKRYSRAPVILQVSARAAWRDGVAFYLGNEDVWLADAVPAQYISQETEVSG